MKHNRLERGQSLVLIILAIVGMLGFAALAIDGGRLLAERRRAQSAADSAALAAAFANSESGNKNVIGSATNLLVSNGFNPSVETIEINNPPNSGPYSAVDDKAEYYQVKIHAVVDKVFSQFIFPGNLEYQVEAVARLKAPGGVADGMGLVANGLDTCQGIRWDGGTVTEITNGSIFSNSDGTAANGGSNCYSGLTNGSPGSISVVNGTIGIAEDWKNNALSDVTSSTGTLISGVQTGTPVTVPVDHIDFEFPPELPYCDDLPWETPDKANHILPAGRHHSVTLAGKADWTMATGMHCFYGDFSVGTKSLSALQENGGVFIAMMQGGIAFSGGTTFDLNYMKVYKDGKGNPWGGMLIYMPWDNDSGLDFQGNTGTKFSGTILAPGPRTPSSQMKCDFGGANQSLSLNASVICHTIGIAGNTTLKITYDPGENWTDSTRMNLSQ